MCQIFVSLLIEALTPPLSLPLRGLSLPPSILLSFLFISNTAMNPAEASEKLGLHRLRDRTWYTQPSCATSGDGLYEGLDWLRRAIRQH